MEELKRQRDLVEYQLEEERKSRKAQKVHGDTIKCLWL